MWRRLWCRLSELLWWRCTRAFPSPACLGILCCAIMARKAAVGLIFLKRSWVSFHHTSHSVIPRKLISPLLLLSDFGPSILDLEMSLLYCGARKPSSGHFGHFQGQAHVRLFYSYLTSLPCHSCRHVENQLEVSCCIYILDSAITSTIYASVESSKVVKACLVCSPGFVSPNLSEKIPRLSTSWRLISRIVWTNFLVDHRGSTLWVAMNWLRCSLRTSAGCYIISLRPTTSIRLHLHPIACCFLF